MDRDLTDGISAIGAESDIERTKTVRRARDTLGAGRGIQVTGEPGSGRSHFVGAVVSGLDETVRRRLWVRDDGRRLDEGSLEKVVDAVLNRGALPIIVADERSRLEPWLRLLPVENELLQIRLEPFDRGATLQIARNLLGGPLAAKTVPVLIPRRPGGDLTVLREALEETVGRGALRVVDGQWTLTGAVPPLDGVRRMIHSRIGVRQEAPPEVQEPLQTALDVIALAPELDLTRTRALLRVILDEDPARLLERLEHRGTIDVVERDGAPGCRLRDPIVELVLPFTLGRLRRRRLSNAIVEALSDRPAHQSSDRELLALARLALPLGWTVDGAALTRAAETALRSSRVDLAMRLATAALASDASIEASLILAAAESQAGRSAEALARLEGLSLSHDEEPHRLRTWRELMRLVAARVGDPNSQWSLPARPPSSSAVNRVEDSADFAALSLPGAEDLDEEALLSSGSIVDPAVVLKGEQVAFEASLAVMKGQSDLAILMLQRAEAELRASGADTFRLRWGSAYSKLWDRSFSDTYDELSLLADEAASLGQAEQEMLCRWSAAWTLGYAGRVVEAAREMQGTLGALERLDLADTAQLARVALAKALAGTGQDEAAWALLAPVLEKSADSPMIDGWAQEARGWVLRGSGRSTEAVEAFLQAAALQGALGFSLSQIIALSSAARAGAATEVIEDVERLAPAVDGCGVALLVRQARALGRWEARADESAMEPGTTQILALEFDAIGADASALGMPGNAAEAYSIAAALHRSAGQERAAAASARLTAEQVALCGTGWFGATGEPVDTVLSRREREIAGLAAEGLSNREIADRLVVSVRTVETHLLRVFRKLGLRRRSELASAISRRPGE